MNAIITYLVNLGQVVELVDGIVLLVHGESDGKQPHVGRDRQGVVKVLGFPNNLEALPVRVDLTDSLLERFLESTSDSHDFTDRLHGRADLAVDLAGKLGQIPLGNLRDDVVERGFKASGSGLGHSVGELREGVSESDLRSGIRKRVSSSLGSERRGPGETGVDLNDTVFARSGVEGVLDIALADDAKMPDSLESDTSEHVVLIVGQSLRWSDDDGVSGVCAKRVKVLHVAANDGILNIEISGRQKINERSLILTSAASRTTSYSNSFQPFILRSIRT